MKNNKFIIAGVTLLLGAGYAYWAMNGESAPALLHPTTQYAIWAAILGALSAVSLPLGALAGITFNPKPKLIAAFTAFGGGALLAALSVELIAPTVMEIVGQGPGGAIGADHSKSHAAMTMFSLIVGCILGGIMFVVLNDMINAEGGYKRKVSTLIEHLKLKKNNGNEAMEIKENTDVVELNKDTEHKEGGSGAMSIWLGLLIDGIPESFVIGAGFLAILSVKLGNGGNPALTDVVPYTLIAGLFLSNFPEALSSSIGMKKQGMSTAKILMMWMSLVILVALGTVVGYYFGSEVPHELEIGIEGLAAGAMLTMIAQTMIPEAVHIGGNRVVGLSTLMGYL